MIAPFIAGRTPISAERWPDYRISGAAQMDVSPSKTSPLSLPDFRCSATMSLMRRLTGPALLESILNRDWPWAGFGIGDLDPQWIEHCEWWQSAGTVVLLFDGLKPRLVCPYGDTSGLAPILASVTDEHIWANVRPEVEAIFLRFYGPDKVVLLRRMYLDRPVTRTGEALP